MGSMVAIRVALNLHHGGEGVQIVQVAVMRYCSSEVVSTRLSRRLRGGNNEITVLVNDAEKSVDIVPQEAQQILEIAKAALRKAQGKRPLWSSSQEAEKIRKSGKDMMLLPLQLTAATVNLLLVLIFDATFEQFFECAQTFLKGLSITTNIRNVQIVRDNNLIDGGFSVVANWKRGRISSYEDMNSVFRVTGTSRSSHQEGDTAGVTSPMVYISMLFSWFAWHVEDHDFHSIKYMHMGAGKARYGVLRDATVAFEDAVRVNGFTGKYLSQMERKFQKWKCLSPVCHKERLIGVCGYCKARGSRGNQEILCAAVAATAVGAWQLRCNAIYQIATFPEAPQPLTQKWSARRQQKLELEKMRMNFQRNLELLKKVVLEWVQAELAIKREEDAEDANSFDNLSGQAGERNDARRIEAENGSAKSDTFVK
ncbi:lysine-specific demethylase REF6 [Tanacetum coccineum]